MLTFLQLAIVGEYIPDGILREDTSLEVLRKEASLVGRKVVFPFLTAIIAAQLSEGFLRLGILLQGVG